MIRRSKVIRAIVLAAFLAMGIVMMFFAIIGLQTIEGCQEAGIPVPWQAWAMLLTVAVWCVIAANVPDRELKNMDQVFTRLDEE